MTTPENANPADRPAWGQPPAGGWAANPADETRSWSPPVEQPDATTRADRPGPAATGRGQPGVWGGAPNPGPGRWGPPNQHAPAWARQPPPGGGWEPPPRQQYPPVRGGDQYAGSQYPGGEYAGGRYPGPQQWGPPAYPPLPGPPSRPARRSRMPFVVAGVVAVAVALLLVLGFVTPGFLTSTVFDRTQLQAGVQRVLTDSYQITGVGEVTCGDPADGPITVRVDDTFTCTTVIDGAPATIPVRIISPDGGYEVGRPA